MKKDALKITKRLLCNTAGSIIYAAGIALFLDPNGLAPGGVSGISIILHEAFGIFGTGTWIILLNIPIMLLGVWKLGFKFLFSTIWSVAVSSLAINFFSGYLPVPTHDPLLACVAGAVLVSSGIGIVFRAGGTTGGTDVIVKLLRIRFPHVSTGAIFAVTDGLVVIAAGLVFGSVDHSLYAGIAVLLQSFVLNMVLYGSDEARLVYIISAKDRVISERFMSELDAGVTYLNGSGAYTGDAKSVLMCVMKMRTLPQAREIVREEDKDAFMIVTKATSVFGEGFKSHDAAEL